MEKTYLITLMLLSGLINVKAQVPLEFTKSSTCNLIGNPEMENPSEAPPYDDCFFLHGGYENTVGWFATFGSPDWMPDSPCDYNVLDYLSTVALPDPQEGRLLIQATNSILPGSGNVFFQGENVSVTVDDVAPDTKYLLSFHKRDGIDPSRIGDDLYGYRLVDNYGLNVTLSRDYNGFGFGPNHKFTHDPSNGTITVFEPQFEQNHVDVISDNTVEYEWSQSVQSFTSPNNNSYSYLNFGHSIDENFLDLGNQYPSIKVKLGYRSIE